jgi:hypothetical protein
MRDFDPANVGWGSTASISPHPWHVRFTSADSTGQRNTF